MITYINKANSQKYRELFNKATKVLTTNKPASLGLDDDAWESFTISSLNEYFAYLETIKDLFNQDADLLTPFLRLPLDEDVLEIDADTRMISIPSGFSRYGIGVQGDAVAEIVYFTIDRFFDSMDLASEDMQIAIQWEVKDEFKQSTKGFSRNFGKEIINVVDKNGNQKSKIIFGWPIDDKLTKNAGIVKFAVRFYKLDSENKFEYSFTTLPYEVNVNATLDYDLVTMPETNCGLMILNRIKSSGVYDPEASDIPEKPTISTELYAINAAGRIIDLPNNDSGVELAISAQPTTSGVISYEWKKQIYDESTGKYLDNESPLPDEEKEMIRREYLEITEDISEDDNSFFYNKDNELIDLSVILEPVDGYYIYNEENDGFKKLGMSDSYIKVYKEFSIATVHSVGKYFVNVFARSGANTANKKSEIITIPGPEKPKFKYSSELNISDNIVHIIADDNRSAVLTADAVTGESEMTPEEVGLHPVIDLEYDWYKGENKISGNLEGDMIVNVIAPESVFKNGPTDLQEKSRINQANVKLAQIGNEIKLYIVGEVESFLSTNVGQQDADHQWVALDIDTKTSDITTLTWRGSALTEDDVVEAASVDLGAGHIVFWIKLDAMPSEPIAIGDVELSFILVEQAPEVSYTFNADKSIMTIQGLPASGLDDVYYAKVTASRNNVKTSQDSYAYRITYTPEEPILKGREYHDGQFVYVKKDYTTEQVPVGISLKNRAGEYNVLTFAVEPPAQSDKLSYIWMKANIDKNNSADYQYEQMVKIQVDIGNALPDLFTDKPGQDDEPFGGIFDLTVLRNLGQIVDNKEENGPRLQLNENTTGYYYCIVVNELNNHRVANVTPFFHVTNES